MMTRKAVAGHDTGWLCCKVYLISEPSCIQYSIGYAVRQIVLRDASISVGQRLAGY